MSNKELVARVSEFQVLVEGKNTGLSRSLEDAIIPLLECDLDLNGVSRDYLARITGRSDRTVDYLLRIFNGEDINEILKSVPKTHSTRMIAYVPGKASKKKSEEEDGAYSNAKRIYEDNI